jgi:hypothetical protein
VLNSFGNRSEVAGDARQITSEDGFIARRERRRDVKGSKRKRIGGSKGEGRDGDGGAYIKGERDLGWELNLGRTREGDL